MVEYQREYKVFFVRSAYNVNNHDLITKLAKRESEPGKLRNEMAIYSNKKKIFCLIQRSRQIK